jgi:hypothetical protein
VLVAVLAAATQQMAEAAPCSATLPVSSITKTTNGNIRITWVSDTNDVYVAQYTTNLTWFNQWFVGQDNITNQGTSTTWEDAGGSYPAPSDPSVTKRFYRIVRKDANYGVPCVNLLSPTNGATVSGIINVGVAASDDSRISSVTLIVDGQDFATITDGPMSFSLPTTFFSNGVHTIAARATDNAGLVRLGGDPNSPYAVNVATSETVQVVFQNDLSLDWFEAFQSSLPLQASLTTSNAGWTITIKSEGGATLKTLSGSTSNGKISAMWDGTDNSSNPVPYNAVYYVTISATPEGGGGLAAMSGPASATFATFREQFVGTAATILVRQKFIRTDVQAAAIGRLQNIKNWIALAEYNSDVYLGTVFEMAQNAHWDELLGYLADPSPRDITQFYYYGHAGPDGIGWKETTPNKGLAPGDISLATGNWLTNADLPIPHFRTPYKFVFIDACESAQGAIPEAFGIKRATTDYESTGRKNRAFMGWMHIAIADTLLNVYYGTFTTHFWEYWTQDSSRSLRDAVNLAFDDVPLVQLSELKIFGYDQLRWAE